MIKSGSYTNFRLFDLQRDPGQQEDLSEKEPEILQELKEQLLQINASVMADGADWHLK